MALFGLIDQSRHLSKRNFSTNISNYFPSCHKLFSPMPLWLHGMHKNDSWNHLAAFWHAGTKLKRRRVKVAATISTRALETDADTKQHRERSETRKYDFEVLFHDSRTFLPWLHSFLLLQPACGCIHISSSVCRLAPFIFHYLFHEETTFYFSRW
jgi:hypothetical protein